MGKAKKKAAKKVSKPRIISSRTLLTNGRAYVYDRDMTVKFDTDSPGSYLIINLEDGGTYRPFFDGEKVLLQPDGACKVSMTMAIEL